MNRQFALLLALACSERGLTKADVLTSVDGYRQTSDASGITPALERKFERDKEDLRDIGIDIETLEDPSAPGDNQLTRYRVRAEGGSTPLDLDAHESAILSLAAAAWREGALSSESRRGLMKLRSRGVERLRDAPSIAPRLRGREPQFDAFTGAIAAGRAVAFDYVKQGAALSERRRVEPLALVQYGGRWLLVGYDLDRGAERRFLLRRVRDGSIAPVGRVDETRAAARSGRDIGAESLADLHRFAASHPVIVEVRRGGDAELRLARRAVASNEPGRADAAAGASVQLTIEMADLELLADELAGYGPELVVREPPELRDAVAERLRRVLDDHEEPAAFDRPVRAQHATGEPTAERHHDGSPL
ncbi:WYL domain-containing protein [Pseudoclavibacter endophyticus]|nr:WYL domain-containing protein [Pseudoclavibacter endophyticus]